jgi:hypothetical protein
LVFETGTEISGAIFDSDGADQLGFCGTIESYAQLHQVPMLTFEKGQRKDDMVAPYIKQVAGQEGIVLIGKA